MANSHQYREKLYKDYFQTQSGRGKGGAREIVQRDFRQFEKELMPLMPQNKDARVLDIGCGYGSLLLFLKEKGYNALHGVDVSPEQVKVAQELGLQHVVEDDVFNYLEQQEKFDVITGFDIIEHFSKDELLRLLERIRISLKPWGVAILRTPNMDAPFGSVYAYGDFTHEVLLNASSAKQLMLTAGFQQIVVQESVIDLPGAKNILQKPLWGLVKLVSKATLFASGRSTEGVVFTPNLIIVAQAMKE